MTRRIIRLGESPGDDRYSRRIQEFSDNLVAHWPLDDRAGAVAVDRTGRNDGVITGATLGQPGIGDGLTSQYFDGTNDYIDISAIASNLIPNPGFETAGGGGADIWDSWVETVGDGALANEAVVIHTGADACKITAGATANTDVYKTFSTVLGATYTVKFWARGDGADEGRYYVYSGGFIVAKTGTGVTAAAYTEVSFTFTGTGNSTGLGLLCSTTDTAVSYFDTVSLRRTDVPTFDPHEGSLIVWFDSDGLTDSASRELARIRVDALNMISISDDTTNNRLTLLYLANSTQEAELITITDGFHNVGITWSLSGDAVNYYYDGVVSGTEDTALGVISGNLDTTRTVLGAANDTPANPFLGNLAHSILSNTAWDADTMKYLMRLPS